MGIFRIGLGQQHLSGLGAALGVLVAAIGTNALFGFEAAAAAGAGAMCVSVVDQPSPTAQKLALLLLSLVFVGLTSLATGLSQPSDILLGALVVVVSFLAALLTAYGRAALPLSVSVSLALVLTLGAPLPTPADAAQHAGFMAFGAAIYVVWAMGAARVLEFHNKRLALGDCLRALAECLRTQARFYDRESDLDEIYRTLIDRQAVLTERLQSARNLIYDHINTPADRRLVAEFFVTLDIFESALSSQTDYRVLRRRFATADVFVALRTITVDVAADLERLAQTFDAGHPAVLIDYRATLAPVASAIARTEEAARTKSETAEDVQALMALRTTFNKMRYAVGEVERLHRLAASPEDAPEDSVSVDLSRFVQRPNFRVAVLSGHLSLASPVLRYAIRMALAMGFGFAIARVLPYASHGNWILLTIALVMRANYSITKKRRAERFVGNVLGCLIGAFMLHTLPPKALFFGIFAAIGVAHAYTTRNYMVTATAGCVMALLVLHVLAPTEGALFVERVLDTAVGAGIAYLFSYVLPHWEHESASRLVQDLLKADLDYVRQALRVTTDDQAYRLARKRMLDGMATLSGTLSRMLDEPRAMRHRQTEALGAFLTANHLLASHLASVQMFLRNRAKEIDRALLESLFDAARAKAESALTSAIAALARKASAPEPTRTAEIGTPPDGWAPRSLAVGDPEAVVRLRLALVENEVRTLQTLAATLAASRDTPSGRPNLSPRADGAPPSAAAKRP